MPQRVDHHAVCMRSTAVALHGVLPDVLRGHFID